MITVDAEADRLIEFRPGSLSLMLSALQCERISSADCVYFVRELPGNADRPVRATVPSHCLWHAPTAF
jgi:hypothetical protein